MRTVIFVNAFIAFLIAPFLGLFMVTQEMETLASPLLIPTNSLHDSLGEMEAFSEVVGQSVSDLGVSVSQQGQRFKEHDERLTTLSKQSSVYKVLSDDTYEKRILNMLGPAVYAHISDRVEIKIFELNELGYRGYIAKVKLFDPTAFKVVISEDRLGELATTSSETERGGGILGINGGGFYKETRDGKSYAQLIGNTVINGSLVEPFNGYPGDLFFAGIDRYGRVIGSVPQTEDDLMRLKPYQGVSFIPVLIYDGNITNIPDKWKETKQPRTILGRYANNDLILIVIDGRQGDWSVGVTLERLQEKLLELGVKEAYNLDGGGSSVMYYNGEVLNRPSDGNQRPVGNHIIIQP